MAEALPTDTKIPPSWQAEAEAGPVANNWVKSFDDPVLEALVSRTDAVRIATIQYKIGRKDLLWVSALQSAQLATEASVLKLTASQHLNRIQLHLALGGSFDAVPAAAAGADS